MNNIENLKDMVFSAIALPGNRRAKKAQADMRNLRSIVRNHLNAHDAVKLSAMADEIAQGVKTLESLGKAPETEA